MFKNFGQQINPYSFLTGEVPKDMIEAAVRGNLVNQHVMDMATNPNAFRALTMDAAVASGNVFLQSELEKRDPKVREPLTSVTWMRDIVAKTGGGWVDYTSTFNVDYATVGPNLYGIVAGQTNNIPIMQANVGKDIYPVFPWMNVLKVTFVDMQKSQGVGRSLDDMLDKGIRLNWNKSLDYICYLGVGSNYGLVNNSNISASLVAEGASGSTAWSTKTPEEIRYDINTAMVTTWSNSEYDVTGMANFILLPPVQYTTLASVSNNIAGYSSILTWLLDNNIGKTQGVDLQIFPSRWCIGRGEEVNSVATDRMVCYVNDEDRVYMDITVPITRAMTAPDVVQAAYVTLYAGQIGVPKFLYYSPCAYYDGI